MNGAVNRIETCFRHRGSRKALVTFITAGDPFPHVTVDAMHALVSGGADVIELGIPFSDPEAEGPAIQASSERALAQGVRMGAILEMVQEFRRTDSVTPVVLMGYLNSVTAHADFASRAAAAGVDGLIVVNLPPEEAQVLQAAFDASGLALIFLVAPTTTDARAQMIVNAGSGFVYYVSLKGITGANHLDADSVNTRVAWLATQSPLPVCIGFGIKDGAGAVAVATHAAGVVVGSALVNTMAALAPTPDAIPAALTAQVREIRNALDASFS